MSREIDERVVAMYFDNRNFEDGARKTLKTLEKLKQETRMEGAEKGFETLQEAGKKLNFDKASEQVNKLKKSVSTLGNGIEKALTIGTKPLSALHNFFHVLDGYITKVAGINIASKIVNTLERSIRELTIAPVSRGWQQYESTIDSVKTIMSSTGETVDMVKEKLNEMTEYANKTVFSLQDMTSNVGKFTNNGIKLEDATKAMIGLANATADAGQGAQQASMAMYNVSQALGVGKMTTIDWKSLENANIATTRLKQTLIDSAVAQGQLTKKTEKQKDAVTGETKEVVKYFTKAEKGQKSMEVTVENFRDTLSKGWLDKESMMKTFQIFSNQLSETEIQALGFSREEAVRLKQIGVEAEKAATEVRTYSKMVDALKESTQTRWSQNLEYIIGDIEEGTNFWTKLNNRLDEILTRNMDGMQDMLLKWRGLYKDENGQIRKIETWKRTGIEGDTANADAEMLKGYATDYREVLLNGFWEIFDSIMAIRDAIHGAFTDVFGDYDFSDFFIDLTKRFKEFADGFKEWLGSADDANSKLSKIRNIFKTIFTVARTLWSVIKTIAGIAWNIFKPIFDTVIDLFGGIGDFLGLKDAKNLGDVFTKIGDKLKGLWDKLTHLDFKTAIGNIGKWFSDLGGKILGGISGWLLDNGFEGVVTWFTDLGDNIAKAWEDFKTAFNDTGIPGFLTGIWESVKSVFTAQTDENGNIVDEAPIVKFFKDLWTEHLSPLWETVKSGFQVVWDFLSLNWGKFSAIFTPVKNEEGEVIEEAPIVTFLNNLWTEHLEPAWKKVKEVFGVVWEFLCASWEGIKSIFSSSTDSNGNVQDPPIVTFFKNLKDTLLGAWRDFLAWFNSTPIPGFLSGVWNSIVGVFTSPAGKQDKKAMNLKYDPNHPMATMLHEEGEVYKEKNPIIQFFENTWQSIQDIWDRITTWLKENGVFDFFSGIWEKVAGLFVEKKDKVGNVIEKAPIVKFFEDVWSDIQTIWGKIVGWDGWPAIGKFFTDMWGWLVGLFNGEASSTAGADTKDIKKTETEIEEEKKLAIQVESLVEQMKKIDELDKTEDLNTEGKGLFESIGDFFTRIFNAIADAVNKIGTSKEAQEILSVFKEIITVIWEAFKMIVDWISRIVTGEDRNGIKRNWTDWLAIVGLIAAYLIPALIKMKTTGNMASISVAENALSSFGMQMLEMAVAIGIITIAIQKLGEMDDTVLAKGAGVIVLISSIFTFMAKFLNMGSSSNVKDKPKWCERVLNKLIGWVGIAGSLYILIQGLPEIIRAIGEAKKTGNVTGDDLLKLMLGISTIILTVSMFSKVISTIGDNGVAFLKGSVFGALGVMAAIGIVMMGFYSIVRTAQALFETYGFYSTYFKEGEDAASDLILDAHTPGNEGVMSQKGLERFLLGIKLIEAVGKAIGAFFGSIVGAFTGAAKEYDQIAQAEGAEKSSESLAKSAETLQDTTTESIEHVTEIMGIIRDFTSTLPNFSGFIDKWVNGDKLATFGRQLPDFAAGVTGFAAEISEKLTVPDSTVFKNLTYVLNMLFTTFNTGYNFQNSPQFIADWLRSNKKDLIDIYDILSEIINESVQQGLQSKGGQTNSFAFDATPIVDAICGALGLGSFKISQATHEMVQEGINMSMRDEISSVGGSAYWFTDFGKTLILLSDFINTTEYANADKLKGFGEAFGEIGSGLQLFAVNTRLITDEDFGRMSGTVIVLREMAELFYRLYSIPSAHFFDGNESQGSLGITQKMKKMILEVAGIGDSLTDDDWERIERWGTNLHDAIQAVLGTGRYGANVVTFDTTSIVDGIVTSLGFGKTKIAEAVHDFVQEGMDAYNKEVEEATNNGGDILSWLTQWTNPENGILGNTGGWALNGLTDEFTNSLLNMGFSETDIDKYMSQLTTSLSQMQINIGYSDLLKINDDTGNLQIADDVIEMWGSIQEAVEGQTDLELEIHPVFNLDELNAGIAQIRDTLGTTELNEMGQTVFKVGLESYQSIEEMRNIRAEIENTRYAMERGMNAISTDLGGRIEALGGDMAKMRLYLDTQALVGGILPYVDQGLYDRARRYDRTGVTPTYSIP